MPAILLLLPIPAQGLPLTLSGAFDGFDLGR